MKPLKTYLSLTLLIILATISWIISCTHDAKLTDLPEVCFERDVMPIFANNCAISGCHDGQGREGRALNTYDNISRSVVPGKPNSSSVYTVLTDSWGMNLMPPNQPLSLENRIIVRVWIEQGAKLTTCTLPIAKGKKVETGINNSMSN